MNLNYLKLKEMIDDKVDSKLYEFQSDMNTLKRTGFHYVSGTAQNSPEPGYSFYTTVISINDSYVVQYATKVVKTLWDKVTYMRFFTIDTWTEWEPLYGIRLEKYNVDVNNITESGIYYFNGNLTGENRPTYKTGVLEVFNGYHVITQRFTTYDGQEIYTRGYYGNQGGWNQWKQW